jgi:hypothetical protein
MDKPLLIPQTVLVDEYREGRFKSVEYHIRDGSPMQRLDGFGLFKPTSGRISYSTQFDCKNPIAAMNLTVMVIGPVIRAKDSRIGTLKVNNIWRKYSALPQFLQELVREHQPEWWTA